MSNFQAIQHRIAEHHYDPPADAIYEAGYGLLRQCEDEAQALLAAHFDPEVDSNDNAADHIEKRLQRQVSAKSYQSC